jgi:hypothetical protein
MSPDTFTAICVILSLGIGIYMLAAIIEEMLG